MTGYAIVLASGELERITAASIIGSVAASMDIPVSIFVTMEGLGAFERERVEARDFDGGAIAQAMATAEDVRVPLFTEQLRQAKEIGPLEVYACTMVMDLLGTTIDDYVDVFDGELGVAGFLNKAEGKEVIFV
ncbi:Peroxiredoxin family protein [Halogranum gelatinilyticum]|uniref:Peroxiredoxin family protein n=1 Tax=Halogranum gelatinilyticum TaxID=660521 RepID=A0A1G9P668_9EURY|nr:DsrE/DsrF/DrsH-like family protein [Halogranum gelatinilyticum]SDL94230.1 Peroxiredoxin family protein [Halogranum gelatinilyticum]